MSNPLHFPMDWRIYSTGNLNEYRQSLSQYGVYGWKSCLEAICPRLNYFSQGGVAISNQGFFQVRLRYSSVVELNIFREDRFTSRR